MNTFVRWAALTWSKGKVRHCHRCKRKLRPGTGEAYNAREIGFGSTARTVLCGTCIPIFMNEIATELEAWTLTPPAEETPRRQYKGSFTLKLQNGETLNLLDPHGHLQKLL